MKTAQRHHYVPKLILKRFATGKAKRVHVYRKTTGEFTEEPVKEVFQREGFYSDGEDNSLEEEWGAVETDFDNVLTRARAMENKHIERRFSEEDAKAARLFFAMQFIRNPSKLESVEQRAEELNYPPEDARNQWPSMLKQHLDDLRAVIYDGAKPKPNGHVAEHIHEKYLIGVPVRETQKRFILGGCHVLHLCPMGIGSPVLPNETSFVMPVSPTLALALVADSRAFIATLNELVDEFNRFSFVNSNTVVGKRKEDLVRLAKRHSALPLYAIGH